MNSENPIMSAHVHETITLSNQQDSTLLHLPPEIRNRIYEHVFGGLQICPLPCHPSTPGRYVIRVKDQNDGFDAPWRTWLDRVSFLRSCRQVYLEAALLIFKLNEFHLLNFAPFHFFKIDLTDDQRSAIESVRFSFNDGNMKQMAVQISGYWRDFTSPRGTVAVTNFDAGVLFPFESLPNLKRVVAEIPRLHRSSWYTTLREKAVEGIIKQWGGPNGLEIEFKKCEDQGR